MARKIKLKGTEWPNDHFVTFDIGDDGKLYVETAIRYEGKRGFDRIEIPVSAADRERLYQYLARSR